MSDDFLSSLANDAKKKPAPKSRSGRRSGKLQGNLITQGTSQDDVAKAKGKKPIKGRVRKTIYIDTSLVDEIDASAQAAEIGISDFYNVLLESAFAAWQRGEIEVEYTEEVVVKRGIKVKRP